MFDGLPTASPDTIETLQEKLEAADREIKRLRAILQAAGLDGVRGDALLPVKQHGGRGLF